MLKIILFLDQTDISVFLVEMLTKILLNSSSLNGLNTEVFVRCSSSASRGILEGFKATIGNTPLIRLESFSKESGCNILVKNEYMKYVLFFLEFTWNFFNYL